MLQMFHEQVTSFLIFTPLVTCFIVWFAPHLALARRIALAGAGLTFLFSLHIWYYFEPSSQLQFAQNIPWIPEFGIGYTVGIDGISLLLVVLTAFLTPLTLISIWHLEDRSQKSFIALIMALETGMLGALVAVDMVLFYIFWEVMLIPMYFMIGVWGGKNRIYATTKFIIYTAFGSLLLLIAAITLYLLHFDEFGFYSTNLLHLYKLSGLPLDAQKWLFLAFALAFAIKVPIWPFHTWLPHAHTEAPTVGSVILAGIMLKMGTYGFLRFAIPLFPTAVSYYSPLILTLGIIGIIYGALVAWAQTDAKKLVAYSSVSHLGFVVVGSVAILEFSLSPEALTGAAYQMINHGVSTGMLFFLVGMIYERRHSRQIKDFGGIAKVMPWFGFLLIIATLGSVGLPGTGGFVGEFLILVGLFKANMIAAILASLGVLLGAIYMLYLCRKILFGPITHDQNHSLKDISTREWLYMAPLAFLIVFMGVQPELFLHKAKPSLEHLAKNFYQYKLVVAQEEQTTTQEISARSK